MARKPALQFHNGHRSSFSSSSPVWNTCLTLVKVFCCISLYWLCSISLTFFNRHLFRDYKFPLSITALHMAIKFSFAALIRWFLHSVFYCSCCTKLFGKHQNGDRERVNLTWPILWRKVAPTGNLMRFLR